MVKSCQQPHEMPQPLAVPHEIQSQPHRPVTTPGTSSQLPHEMLHVHKMQLQLQLQGARTIDGSASLQLQGPRTRMTPRE